MRWSCSQDDYQPLAASSAGLLPAKHCTVKELALPMAADADDQTLLAQMIELLPRDVASGVPKALAYLEAPRHRHPRSNKARSSWALPIARLGYRLPEKNRVEGAAIRGQLQRLGVVARIRARAF